MNLTRNIIFIHSDIFKLNFQYAIHLQIQISNNGLLELANIFKRSGKILESIFFV